MALHFHPDRPCKADLLVVEALLKEGIYRSQFETNISNGGLTAFRGGQRDQWEARLFNGVYQQSDITASERPKYGALDLMNHADGPAPRFGSCYFKLNADVSKRCSFTYQDSVTEPEAFGTIDDLVGIMAALLTDVVEHGQCFGAKNLTISALLNRLSHISNPKINYSSQFGRSLDDYIEAQIHGPIDLHTDVTVLVTDASFQQTHIGELLMQLCTKYDIILDWHAGFQIQVDDIPSAFRGPKIPALAQRIVGNDGWLNTALIGQAAVSLYEHPDQWRDLGTYTEVLQYIKQLWHTLAYYGHAYIKS